MAQEYLAGHYSPGGEGGLGDMTTPGDFPTDTRRPISQAITAP